MTKNDIAAELCTRIPDLPKSMALDAIDGVTEILAAAFVRGDNVYLRGFGTLEVKTTSQKVARNINAGTAVIIPPRRTVKLKLCKQLKNRMNNDTVD